MKKRTVTLVALAGALLLGSLPVDAEEQPLVTDAAGDANGVNGQGVAAGLENAPDARPASIDSADITQIRYSTSYYSVKYTKPNGATAFTRFLTGFNIHFTTTAPASPTFGPTLVYRVPATIPLATGTCDVFFQAWVRGPLSVPDPAPPTVVGDTPERADIRMLTTNCPRASGTGTGTITNGFTLSYQGNVMTLSYPFSAPSFTGGLAEFLKPGVVINPQGVFINATNDPHVRPLLGTAATVPTIDETARMASFTIGSDVPPDVHCDLTPDHPECPPPPAPPAP